MLVTGIQHFSLDDGPGIRTTVFLAGCNMRCLWCHNPEAVEESLFSITAKNYGIDELWNEICTDRNFYQRSKGGVTFSGGEPVLHGNELKLILHKCRENGISTAIETAGNYPFGNLEMLLEDLDLVIMDLKAYTESVHERCTGKTNKDILENIRQLSMLDVPVWVRIPVVWNVNITKDEMTHIADFLKHLKIEHVELIPYHRYGISKYEKYGLDYALKDIKEPTEHELKLCEDILKRHDIDVENF
jgi:pyruvate formate lyase activating enzyme